MQGMTPQQLAAKFHQMGILLLLDAPAGLEFGIDNISWQVGSKFKGIKLIPLGTHVITYSLKTQNHMFPIKKFVYFGPTHRDNKDDQRIRVYRWSPRCQRFVSLKGQQAQGYRQGVKKYHFDCYLGPYPPQNIEFWSANTKYISKEVLDKLDPIEYYEDYHEEYEGKKKEEKEEGEGDEGAGIDSGSEEEIQGGDLEEVVEEMEEMEIVRDEEQGKEQTDGKKGKKKGKQEQDINQIKKNKDFGGNIYYSQIPRRLSESLPHTTLINLDKTPILESILLTSYPKNQLGLLGQLQYSFISFLIGQCLDSFNQWKQLVIVFCASETAYNGARKGLMLEFVAVLYEQVKQFPEDFFIDELAKGNFLNSCFRNLNQYCIEKTINKKAMGRIEKLLNLVSEKFGYQPIMEEDDQSPMIVTQDEQYF